MVRQSRHITRRDLWRVRSDGWRSRLRLKHVWVPMLIGLLIVCATGWWYASQTAFAGRAVVTTAIVEDISVTRLEHQYEPPSLIVRGWLRYQVDGRTVRSSAEITSCQTAACASAAGGWRGRSVRVVYDPHRITRVRLGSRVSRAPGPTFLFLVAVGVGAIGVGASGVFFEF
jgi:hypothetical protein